LDPNEKNEKAPLGITAQYRFKAHIKSGACDLDVELNFFIVQKQ